jgi:predicted AAA+ superfamily ATPase
VAARLDAALDAAPVVVVMGARQTGKSTLVQSHPALRDHRYLSLDDVDLRDLAERAPEELLARGERLILDEVQRVPDLLLAVKRAVDRDRPRRRGRFVLTGSANLLLMHRVSESLAGRAAYVQLWPFTRGERAGKGRAGRWSALLDAPFARWEERLGQGGERADWREEARLGGYPTPALELAGAAARATWFGGYLQTYLERDLRDHAAIDALVDFRRLMRAACLRIGNLANQAELARDAGVPPATAHRWLNVLEASFQLRRLEPYSVNRTRRLVKTPKLYWTDTALALYLAGIEEPEGAHLENLILADLMAWRDGLDRAAEVMWWRSAAGTEVDFVIEQGRKLLAVEVKSTGTPRSSDARQLAAFRDEYGSAVHGCLLLHTGDEVTPIGRGILAAPWWHVL